MDKHNILYDSSNLGKEALDRIRKGDKYDLILLDDNGLMSANTIWTDYIVNRRPRIEGRKIIYERYEIH